MRVPRLPTCSLIGLAIICSVVPATADEIANEAAQRYSAAVALQNQQLYDLAAEEWQAFIDAHPQHELSQRARYYLGVCYFQQQRFAEAERAFAAVVDQGGPFKLLPSAYLNLGLAQFNQSQEGRQREQAAALGRAVTSLNSLLQRFADSSESAEAAFYLAESYYGLGQRDQAIDVYQRTLRKYPRHPRRTELLYGLGVAAEEANRNDLAGDAFGQLTEMGGTQGNRVEITEAHVRLADLLLAAGDTKQAMRSLQQAVEDERSSVADYARLRLAECHLVAKDYQTAAAVFESLIAKYPESEHRGKAVIGAARSRFFAGDYAGVSKWLMKHRMRLEGPAIYEAAHWQSRAHLKLNELDAAAEAAESALRRLRSTSSAHDIQAKWQPALELDYADALFEGKQLEKARVRYARLAERFPTAEVAPEAAYMAALAAVRQGNYQEAIAETERFQQHFANRDDELVAEISAIQAESLLQLGKHQASARLWRQLLRERPQQAAESDWPLRLAACLQAEGDHLGVIKTIERYPTTDRSLVQEANLMLGSAYAELGRVDEARRVLQRVLRQKLTLDQQASARLMLAGLWRQSGDLKQALTTLKQLTASKSEVPASAFLAQADLYFELREFTRATQSYETAIELGQKHDETDVVVEGLLGMGWSLLESGSADQAEVTFAEITEDYRRHAGSTDALYGEAVALQRQNKYASAIPVIERFVERSSDRAAKVDARFVLGLCQAGAKKHRAAVATLTKLVRDYPDYESNDQALYELAWSLQSLGRAAEAAETFEMLAKVFPQSSLAGEAAFRFAESKYESQDFKTAERYYCLAAKQGRGALRETALHKRGWAYFHRGAYDQASQAFQEQLQQFSQGPKATDARLMLAECAFQQREFEPALKSFQAGFGVPGSGQETNKRLRELALLHAGQAAGQLGQWQESLQWLQQAVERYPDSDYTQEATYEQGRALQALGKYDQAAPLFERVAEAHDGLLGARARFMLGELQFLEKDFAGAIRTFFKVAYGYGHPKAPTEYHTWQANAMFEAARCCESTGRVHAARKLYEDLLEFFPESDKADTARKKLKTLGG